MSSCPACRPGLPALLPRPSAPLSATKRAVHRTRPAHYPFKLSSPTRRRRARVISSCHERRLMLIPAISLTIGSLQYSLEKGAAKAEFTDMPALRGKDYGKTKMSYADYTKTESGLQYKDLRVGDGPSPRKGETTVLHGNISRNSYENAIIGRYGGCFEKGIWWVSCGGEKVFSLVHVLPQPMRPFGVGKRHICIVAIKDNKMGPIST
ncbi:hypothetical protein ZWY2020_014619 [Hordeum vulgare]|nr:hypothetical protein ZWY2020_014619 [Hordeum vulgare]